MKVNPSLNTNAGCKIPDKPLIAILWSFVGEAASLVGFHHKVVTNVLGDPSIDRFIIECMNHCYLRVAF